MPKLLKTISMIALMAMSGAVVAQTTTETAPAADAAQAEAPATDAAPNPDADLSLGEPADGGPGTPYIREDSGDWKLECLRVETGDEPCQLFQALSDDQGNQVANMRMFRLPSGGQAIAGALVAVPLETLLTAQLTIAVDGAKGKRYPFSVCDRLGCYARIGFTNEDVAQFKRGAKATVTLVPFVAPDQKVELPLSLKGFTAGYDMISVVAPQQ